MLARHEHEPPDVGDAAAGNRRGAERERRGARGEFDLAKGERPKLLVESSIVFQFVQEEQFGAFELRATPRGR